jgi:hypothetical protein
MPIQFTFAAEVPTFHKHVLCCDQNTGNIVGTDFRVNWTVRTLLPIASAW